MHKARFRHCTSHERNQIHWLAELSSCEVRGLNQFRTTCLIRIGQAILPAWLGWELRSVQWLWSRHHTSHEPNQNAEIITTLKFSSVIVCFCELISAQLSSASESIQPGLIYLGRSKFEFGSCEVRCLNRAADRVLIYKWPVGVKGLMINDTFCKFSHKFPKEKIPTLEEVVELCSSLGLKMLIEIKKGTNTHEVKLSVRVSCLQYFPIRSGMWMRTFRFLPTSLTN